MLRPLFPGYIFVQMPLETRLWRPILSTLGVRQLVQFGERPGSLDNGFIQCLRARELDGAIPPVERPFAAGQQARFEGGAFDGQIVTILRMDENDRLVVLMDILSRSVKMKVSSDQLRAV